MNNEVRLNFNLSIYLVYKQILTDIIIFYFR